MISKLTVMRTLENRRERRSHTLVYENEVSTGMFLEGGGTSEWKKGINGLSLSVVRSHAHTNKKVLNGTEV